jgi:deoxyribodipyrimidine photo-lyase
MQKLVVYWARRDFRLRDNAALYQAVEMARAEGAEFLPLFVLDEGLLAGGQSNIGYPRRLFLSRVLEAFSGKFERFEVVLGSPEKVFAGLRAKYDLHVFCNHDVEPFSRARDTAVAYIVGVDRFVSCRDQLTIPSETRSGTGGLYAVFSPLRNNVLQGFLEVKTFEKPSFVGLKYFKEKLDFETLPAVASEIFARIDVPWVLSYAGNSLNLDEILERPQYLEWEAEEEAMVARFGKYVDEQLIHYKRDRDNLEKDTYGNGRTSKMSVALKWGLISPRTMKDMILARYNVKAEEGVFAYVSELIWREFYKYILFHTPEVMDSEFQEKFRGTIPWKKDRVGQELFLSWIRGETGYEVVDAAMKQIASMGWMHNRSRMIVASILTKNLGVDWRWGQEYFRAVLLDLDEASNNGGWQWGASVGADPKPIRIFNPYLQQENYDAQKKYIRRWLGDRAPIQPLIDHRVARDEAIIRYRVGPKEMPRDY